MNTAIILLLAFFGGSYLWAMRGTILGGQKGAIHPGAFLGLIIALATGSQYMIDNMWVLTAVGGAAMFFGGSQSYGQTLDLAMEKDDYSRRTAGRVGVFMKGATWFGIFAGIIAVAFNAMIGAYKPLELVIFVALIPVCKWLGFLVLNSPQKPKKGKLPIFYFSEGRFEMWGGLTFVVLQLIAFAIAKQDWFILIMTLVGFLAGGLGFTIGVIMQNSVKWADFNNRYIFGKLQKAGFVSGWKTMEFTLGGVGGLGTVLCFILTYPKEKLAAFEASGASAISVGDDTIKWLTIGWIVAAVIYCVLSIIPEPPKKVSDIEARLKSGEISQKRADELMKTASKEKSYAFRNALEGFADEVYHWFVLVYLGILLPLLGCTFVAKLLSVGMIFWVVAEKFIKKNYHKRAFTKILPFKVIMVIAAIAVFALQFVTEFTGVLEFTPFALFAFYLLSYEILEMFIVFGPKGELRNFNKLRKEGKKVDTITVRVFSWIEIAVCFIIGALIMI